MLLDGILGTSEKQSRADLNLLQIMMRYTRVCLNVGYYWAGVNYELSAGVNYELSSSEH